MTVATMYGHKHTHTGPSRMRNMGRGDWYAGRKFSPPSQENKTVGENRVEVIEQAKNKTQCVRLPPGDSLGCCERPQRPITPLEPDFGRQRVFFSSRDASDDLVFLSTPPATSVQSRQSMQHVDELTGESKCAYFQWKESDENATFQSKETQDHKTLPAVHSIQKRLQTGTMALSSKGHAF